MNTAEAIQNDVEQALQWDPSVSAEKIGVSVNKGVVELDGHVGSFYEKLAAERAALRVLNVTSVASEIVVDLPFANTRTDAEIALAASNHLTWKFQVPATIKVTVSNGWLTLTGTTEWNFQKDEAARVVRSLHGVRGVTNEIELKPKASALGIKTKIENALNRDAQIDSNNITVETAGSDVTLRGSVQSWRQRQDAEYAAFGAPGVASVKNLLTVSY